MSHPTHRTQAESAFYALDSFEALADLLKITVPALRQFCHKKHYKTFELSKKAGGKRSIAAPEGALRTIQRRLADILLDVYGGRAPVHGFARERSIKTNAQMHLGRMWVLNIDLQDFFPSIHFGRVSGLFAGKPFRLPANVSRALAQLCCYKGSLPQGSPTSPVISNLICASLDAKLKTLARANNCVYTRYADDLTFSSDRRDVPQSVAVQADAVWTAGPDLLKIISDESFAINVKKTSLHRKGNRQVVTGVIVNEKVNLPGSYVRAVRGMIRAIERDGLVQAEKTFHARYVDKQSVHRQKSYGAVVAGKLNHVGFVKGFDSGVYVGLAKRLQKVSVPFRSGPAEIGVRASRSALDEALWIVEAGISVDYAIEQGTGFSWDRHGIVTAAHAVGEYNAHGRWTAFEYVQVRRPHLGEGKVYQVRIVKVHPHSDLALLEYPVLPLVAFSSSPGEVLEARGVVRILGFPHYHDGDSCTDQDFVINAKRVYSGIHHRVVSGAIIKGNSGGPVINPQKRVVGIALKGQQIPAHFSDKDALSSFAVSETLDNLLYADEVGLIQLAPVPVEADQEVEVNSSPPAGQNLSSN